MQLEKKYAKSNWRLQLHKFSAQRILLSSLSYVH